MSRPCGSATVAAFESASGSEPTRATFRCGVDFRMVVTPTRVVFGCVDPPALPQPAAKRTRAASAAGVDLRTQMNLAAHTRSVTVRLPACLDRPVLAARQSARPREARAADICYASAADVAARQILELKRRRLDPLRSDEQVGAHEESLGPAGLSDERDDLLQVGSVTDHAAGETLVHVRRVPRRR